MRRDPDPFFKWDPEGENARRRRAAHHMVSGRTAEDADRLAGNHQRADPMAGKRWILRWAWVISTGVLVAGYLILVALLTGWGDWLHLT